MLGTTTLKFRAQVNEVYRTFNTLAEVERWVELCRDVPNHKEVFGDIGYQHLHDEITPIIDGVLRGESTLCMFRGKYITIFMDPHSVNGVLLIVPTEKYKEWQSNFTDINTGELDFVTMEESFADAIEDIYTNSQLSYDYGYDWSPTFQYEGEENIWCYNDYQIESFTEAIYTDGFALFTKYQEQTI